MTRSKQSYNLLPALVGGLTEGTIVIMALVCFFTGQNTPSAQILLYCSIAGLFIASLLSIGAYYTRKSELNSDGKNKILNIYKALDIDEKLKNEMTEDTLRENERWLRKWHEADNATSSLSPQAYAVSVFFGFSCGAVIILISSSVAAVPGFKFLVFPVVVLAVMGFIKYRVTGRSPITSTLLLASSGVIAALGAYYIGSLLA